MEIKTNLRKNDWSPEETPHGYGCGYIGLPKEHPWYGKHYNDLSFVNVHGGLTWSAYYTGDNEPDGLWWIGFDTNHWEDNAENCNQEYCLGQIERLKQQALELVNIKNKKEYWLVYDENNNVCEVAESEEAAMAIAKVRLADLEKIAEQRGEWPYFDQIYMAKVTHMLREDQVDDYLQVKWVKI